MAAKQPSASFSWHYTITISLDEIVQNQMMIWSLAQQINDWTKRTPFYLKRQTRAREEISPIDWIKMRFCDILLKCSGRLFWHFTKIQNWNINQFFIDNDYNFSFGFVAYLDENKVIERKSSCSFQQIVCQVCVSSCLFRYKWQWYCNRSYGSLPSNIGKGKTNNQTDKLKFVGFCQFFGCFSSSPSISMYFLSLFFSFLSVSRV